MSDTVNTPTHLPSEVTPLDVKQLLADIGLVVRDVRTLMRLDSATGRYTLYIDQEVADLALSDIDARLLRLAASRSTTPRATLDFRKEPCPTCGFRIVETERAPLILEDEDAAASEKAGAPRLSKRDTDYLLRLAADLEEAPKSIDAADVTRLREIALGGETFETHQQRRTKPTERAPVSGQDLVTGKEEQVNQNEER